MGSVSAVLPRSAGRFFEFALLGLVTSGYLAVVGSGYLDAPTVVLTAAGLLLRGLLIAGLVKFRISARAVAAVTLAYIGFYPLDYALVSHEFLGATVHLVFFVAVARILTASTNRDYLWVKVIAFLELLAASILSPNLNFFVFLAAFLLFGVATFSSSEIRRSAQPARQVARTGQRYFAWRLAGQSLIVALGILALTGGLFFFLPRTARAAFQHFVPDRYRIPGFSNQITLGEIGEFKKVSAPVMHVRFLTREGPAGLKWRGMALSEFDGRRWYNSPGRDRILRIDKGLLQLVDDSQRRRIGRRVAYEVHLRTSGTDVLFLAGIPEFLQLGSSMVIRTATDGYRWAAGTADDLRYGASSYLDPGDAAQVPPQPLSAEGRLLYIRLPQPDPRVAALARQVTAGAGSDEARARAIQDHLRQSYGYTLDLPAPAPQDPIAHFLFERKKGHCEYFASAMTVMLRFLGVPARVVTGFQSGIYNPVSGWYLIRASDAHSWVEAYLPERGWTTFDPTPPDPDLAGPSLWLRLTLYLDAAETFWQDWVLDYDKERQLDLASRVEKSGRTWGANWVDRAGASFRRWREALLAWARAFGLEALAGAILAGLALVAVPRLWRWARVEIRVRRLHRGNAAASDATLLYLRMLRLLRRRGIEKPAWLTPSEFVRVLPASTTAGLVARITQAYHELRFGGEPSAAPRIIALLDQLERTR